MGFLAKVGRADPAKDIIGFLQHERKMELMEEGAKRETRRMNIVEAAEKREATRFTREKQKEAEREAVLNSEINITTHPLFLGIPDEVKEATLKHFQDEGIVDERGVGITRNIKDEVDKIESTAGLFKQFMLPVVDIHKNNFIQKDKELRELLATGEDPNSSKVQKLKMEVDALYKTYNASEKGYLGHLRNIKEGKIAHEQKLEQIEARKVADKVTDKTTAEQKNVQAIIDSRKKSTGEILSYEEAFGIWNSMKGKTKEDWLLEIYAEEIKAGATDEEARTRLNEAATVWDETHAR
jgi:hypothetical protein